MVAAVLVGVLLFFGGLVALVVAAPRLANRRRAWEVRRDLRSTSYDELLARTDRQIEDLEDRWASWQRSGGRAAGMGSAHGQVGVGDELVRLKVYRSILVEIGTEGGS